MGGRIDSVVAERMYILVFATCVVWIATIGLGLALHSWFFVFEIGVLVGGFVAQFAAMSVEGR